MNKELFGIAVLTMIMVGFMMHSPASNTDQIDIDSESLKQWNDFKSSFG